MIASATAYTVTKTLTYGAGVPVNFDSAPTTAMYVNGTVSAQSVTVTNVTTGLYKAAFTTPTLATGDHVLVYATGAVGGINATLEFMSDFCDTVRTVITAPAASTAMTLYQTACTSCATAIGTGNWSDAMRYYAQAQAYLSSLYMETSKDGAALKMRETLDGLKRAIDAAQVATVSTETTRFIGLGTAFN